MGWPLSVTWTVSWTRRSGVMKNLPLGTHQVGLGDPHAKLLLYVCKLFCWSWALGNTWGPSLRSPSPSTSTSLPFIWRGTPHYSDSHRSSSRHLPQGSWWHSGILHPIDSHREVQGITPYPVLVPLPLSIWVDFLPLWARPRPPPLLISLLNPTPPYFTSNPT